MPQRRDPKPFVAACCCLWLLLLLHLWLLLHGVAELQQGRLCIKVVMELLLLLFALLLRLAVGSWPYSGANDPPKFGDYEAQRHWMEITLNLPIQKWYVNSTSNDLSYWGLDYPPMSAYQSLLYGKVIQQYEPAALELNTSRGYETPSSKLLMRWSVVLSDILVFIPAALAAAAVFTPGAGRGRLLLLAAVLLQPAAILIDHGHFQYNGISLGCVLGAASAIAGGHDVIGSVLYCLALNHKQMSLYFAPAFFAHLLGKCLQKKTASGKVAAVARLGVAVIATFALCWAPFLVQPEDALQVVRRIFPVQRGLYEDYVANFWCATSVAVKWKQLLEQGLQLKLCAALTLLAASPSMLHQLMRPSPRGLLLGLANSALAFFMFAFHVHEKSILLPLLPITVLAPEAPLLAAWLPAAAAFSMFPLLQRDGLTLPYLATTALYLGVMLGMRPQQQQPKAGRKGAWQGTLAAAGLVLGLLAAAALHIAEALVPAPERLPWLYDRLYITMSFLLMAPVLLYTNAWQWRLPAETKLKTS